MNKIIDVDPILWNRFVGVARIKEMKAGILLNEVINIFLEKQKINDIIKKL